MSKGNENNNILGNSNINIIPINNVNLKNTKKNRKNNLNKKKKKYLNIFREQIITDKENKIISSKILNDEELNTLQYEQAIIHDKRTYLQYYWSLLKKKQLILFTFIPKNDYNLFSLKISLFLLSFSLYFTVNTFFFNDNTMHKIHSNNGEYNIIYQIPQILYSSIICSIINTILKMLSLSENNILVIKRENNFDIALKNSKKIKDCINIKFICFFVIGNIFIIFFWYFIACFCAVYTNTQIILIKDTLISFTLSMLYPFGLCLLPGFFRIPALKAKNKDKQCLYKISGLITLIF